MNDPQQRLRIAIVGSGVAGLVSAHVLGPHHDVVLFEADDRLGGHTNTVMVEDPTAGLVPVDTGFIVHNDRNYPILVRLFNELGVATVPTEMSFGVTDRDPSSPSFGFTYRASNPNTLFADRGNLIRPTMWRMLRDIRRFYRDANAFLTSHLPGREAITIGMFLRERGYGPEFLRLHLLPMGAAVWSADPAQFDAFPAISLLTFLRNHGLLAVKDRPQWRTIPGGCRTYVDAITARFPGSIRLSTPVRSVSPTADGKVVVMTERGPDVFDRVVIAAHSDQALTMLGRPTAAQREVLSAVRYQPNRATLHTDVSLLSPYRRAWSAWNYDVRAGFGRATLTYDMTELQHLPGSRRYLVSLNSDAFIDPKTVLAQFDYAHPVFDLAAIEAQRRLATVNGDQGIFFAGAWAGYGFHEDGAASALRVCEKLEASLAARHGATTGSADRGAGTAAGGCP